MVEATGEVTSSASVGRDGRLRMEVQLTGIGSPGSVRAASAPVRVGIDRADGFDLGATLRVKGEAAATDPGVTVKFGGGWRQHESWLRFSQRPGRCD